MDYENLSEVDQAKTDYELASIGFEIGAGGIAGLARGGTALARLRALRALIQGGGKSATLPADVLRLAEANLTNSGRTVLGSFSGYIDKARARGASFFDIGNRWDSLTPAQRWAANQHFLDKIAASGDRVLLSIPKRQIQEGTYLAREIDYLVRVKGYRWINQWALVPP